MLVCILLLPHGDHKISYFFPPQQIIAGIISQITANQAKTISSRRDVGGFVVFHRRGFCEVIAVGEVGVIAVIPSAHTTDIFFSLDITCIITVGERAAIRPSAHAADSFISSDITCIITVGERAAIHSAHTADIINSVDRACVIAVGERAAILSAHTADILMSRKIRIDNT